MRAQICSTMALWITAIISTAHAQVAPGAPAAPAAAGPGGTGTVAADSGRAVTPPAGAVGAAPTATSKPVIPVRAAPKATNPVLLAFTPQQGGLTANEVATKAVATSDTIAAKNEELRAAAQAVDTVRYQYLPRLALKASYARLSPATVSLGDGYVVASTVAGPIHTVPYGGTQLAVNANNEPIGAVPLKFDLLRDYYSLSASLGVPISDYFLRLPDHVDAAQGNKEASELNLKAERQKVEADARIAFFNWSLAIGQVAVAEKSLERVKARQKDVLAAHSMGAATKADVMRLEALVASTEAGLVAAQSFRTLAEEHLKVIMGVKADQFAIGEDVLAERSPLALEPLDKLVQTASSNRYELKALDRAAESMRQAEAVTRKAQIPRIDGFADAAYADPNQRYLFMPGWKSSWDVGVAATWNVHEVFTAGSAGSEMAAKRKALEANRSAMAKGIRMEVTSAFTDARKSAAALESAKRGAEAAQIAYNSEVELFTLGRATTTELIDAESELVSAMLALISAHINIRIAETKLARATGTDLHTLGR